MTTKVGAARIRPTTDAADAGHDAAAETGQRQQQAERQADGEGDGGDLEIHRHAGQERRQEVRRQAVDQRAHAGAVACALEQPPEPAAQPDHDHHHRGIEDQQQRVGRGPAAGERGDVGERAQELGRADEARDRRALGGIDQEGHDLGRRRG